MIFLVFCMVISHHVEFLKGQNFIWRDGLEDWGASLCQMLSKLVHPAYRYCDFLISRNGHPAILDFRIREFAKLYWLTGSRESRCISVQISSNWSIACKVIHFFRFFKITAVHHFGFFGGIFWPATVSTWDLYHSAKFGCDRYSRFDNMNFSIFGPFGWLTPIHALKIGVLRQFDPLNGLQYHPKPIRAHPCVSPCHLNHQAWKCGERSDL